MDHVSVVLSADVQETCGGRQLGRRRVGEVKASASSTHQICQLVQAAKGPHKTTIAAGSEANVGAASPAQSAAAWPPAAPDSAPTDTASERRRSAAAGTVQRRAEVISQDAKPRRSRRRG